VDEKLVAMFVKFLSPSIYKIIGLFVGFWVEKHWELPLKSICAGYVEVQKTFFRRLESPFNFVTSLCCCRRIEFLFEVVEAVFLCSTVEERRILVIFIWLVQFALWFCHSKRVHDLWW
jgi:hypothetical protein